MDGPALRPGSAWELALRPVEVRIKRNSRSPSVIARPDRAISRHLGEMSRSSRGMTR